MNIVHLININSSKMRLEILVLEKDVETWEVPFARFEELFHGDNKVPCPSHTLLLWAENVSLSCICHSEIIAVTLNRDHYSRSTNRHPWAYLHL